MIFLVKFKQDVKFSDYMYRESSQAQRHRSHSSKNQLGGDRVAGEIYYNNRITAITSDYNYDRRNARRNTKGKKKFSEILEEKTDTDRKETAQLSHIDVKY